ncbi:von Willebrand factor type A domain-containing protein [Mesorhizobium sp. CAU 1741]|uniref:vWA domain-containing protein n=1 Tax=Mesorhizobium sp. CAU 1741 TaxID=3140366 RepID=UPI00325C209C
MAKNKFDELDRLRGTAAPVTSDSARRRGVDAALRAYDLAENPSAATQGHADGRRLIDRTMMFWREIMQKKLIAVPALTGLVALPVAGLVGWQIVDDYRAGARPDDAVVETRAPARERMQAPGEAADSEVPSPEADAADKAVQPAPLQEAAPPPPIAGLQRDTSAYHQQSMSQNRMTLSAPAMAVPEPMPMPPQARDRLEGFDGNPVRAVVDDPVSTFSIDVDTASYAFVRRSLKEGRLPQPDTVRVEEMINYFPYGWPAPRDAEIPFNTTVTVMPTPWNDQTQLMHVAIKGFDLQPAAKPRSNLVFLIDTSGSMSEPDKLPLLTNSFRLLVDRLGPDDTVSIVTYAGNAGTVLQPTQVSEKATILAALDRLEAGGSTAGEAGLREAYRLAETSFVEGGVNRVMLATDGDFNVGQTSDDDLERLIEDKRETGVYLSVLGFGRGNLNDQMMQAIAQSGNGTAAYIDTLAEAEKVLVEEASSTLFPIADDVKIQVEFNPVHIAEYRLIGYETRALAREDFNNDRVDAGEIGSGHSVTAIYELTPVGSPARLVDDLRYGAPPAAPTTTTSDELAFVKVRYKTPGEDESRLLETPVTGANMVPSFDAAGEDQRFSVAVAALGQKLRGQDALSGFGYDQVLEIASAARGADPFGYRAEFLSLVRLAAALDR